MSKSLLLLPKKALEVLVFLKNVLYWENKFIQQVIAQTQGDSSLCFDAGAGAGNSMVAVASTIAVHFSPVAATPFSRYCSYKEYLPTSSFF